MYIHTCLDGIISTGLRLARNRQELVTIRVEMMNNVTRIISTVFVSTTRLEWSVSSRNIRPHKRDERS